MKQYINTLVKISFVIYISVLFLLLFVKYRGSWWMDLSPIEYAMMHVNLIPFKTIGGYITAMTDGSMNWNIPLENLLGNFFMFLPMGLYLPFIRERIDSVKSFVFSLVPIFFVIELAQFLTRRGSFDIDDFILNLLGALLGYWIWRSSFVQKLVDKIR